MPAQIDGKPVFGPPQIREIFWGKWSRRVKSLVDTVVPQLRAAESDYQQTVFGADMYQDCLTHIIAFEAEAEDLGYRAEPLRSQVAKDLAGDLKPYEHPFRDMGVVLTLLDGFVKEAKEVKMGQQVRGWPAWQTLPLATRRKINDLIEKYAKEQEQGRCEVNLDVMQKNLEKMARWMGRQG